MLSVLKGKEHVCWLISEITKKNVFQKIFSKFDLKIMYYIGERISLLSLIDL